MPKILRIINRLNLGGPTYNAVYLSKYLAPEFETLLVAGMIDKAEASSGFIAEEFDVKPLYIPQMYREVNILKDRIAYFQLKKIISDYKPDIVHTHAAKAGTLGRLAAAACHVPVILHTFHGHVFHSYFPRWKTNLFIKIERYLATKSTRIIAISESQKQELGLKYSICPMEKIEIIPLGFDLKRFSEGLDDKRKRFRDYYKVENDEIVIVIVGRLVPVKNHRLFLEALKWVVDQTPKKVRAFIVGDGGERERLETIAASLQIDFTDYRKEQRRSTLTFTSWIKEIDEVYAGADIVALTSLNEGTPVSLIEAQAAGKAIVTTDVGGIRDIIVPGKATMVVPVDDPDSYSHALLKLINEDSLRENRVNSASVSESFSLHRLVKNTSDLYMRLLKKVSVPAG